MKDDQPQAADNRTPANAILRQLCVMIMMLHNLAVEDLKKKQPSLGTFELLRRREIGSGGSISGWCGKISYITSVATTCLRRW